MDIRRGRTGGEAPSEPTEVREPPLGSLAFSIFIYLIYSLILHILIYFYCFYEPSSIFLHTVPYKGAAAIEKLV
jgi:hypothetical protein